MPAGKRDPAGERKSERWTAHGEGGFENEEICADQTEYRVRPRAMGRRLVL
jgi:hypothetical protein